MIQWYYIKNTIEESKQFIFTKKYDNWLQFYIQIVFESDNLIDYQKDLINDFVGEIVEKLSKDWLQPEFVREVFEQSLQNLNQQLKEFWEKLKTSKYISLKWITWIIYDWMFLSSMIWDVSMIIFRDEHTYYKVYNDIETNWVIDVFSDFIDGELEYGDQIFVVSTNYKNILTKSDLKELESVLWEKPQEIIEILYQIFISKIDKEKIWFLMFYDYNESTERKISLTKSSKKSLWLWKHTQRISKNIQLFLIKNKYPIVVWFLSIFVLLIWYSIIVDAIEKQEVLPTIQTENWTKVITIETIRRDIDRFQKLDPMSNEKTILYKEIMEEISFLEQKWLRIDDVKKLKDILKEKYYQWFNVAYIDNNSPDIVKVYTFNSQEKSTLGQPVSLLANEVFTIWWKKWWILWAVNDEIKWTLIDANIESNIKKCTYDFARIWLFCFTDTNKLIHISKWWVYDMSIILPQQEEWENTQQQTNEVAFDSPIADLEIYRKNNLYILHKDKDLIKQNKYITRYVNQAWNPNLFKPWIQYKIVWLQDSWVDLWFNDFTIDTTFLAWSPTKKSLYQMRRDKWIDTVNIRKVNMQWWDLFEDEYSPQTKVITNIDTKYVYLFDPVNQTFTVYLSSPQKTNDKFLFSYSLIYIMRFKFALNDKILDAVVPPKSWNKPYLFLLTKNWILQINLSEFIKKYEDNE